MVELGVVISKLMSANNAERRQAEQVYNNQKTTQPMSVLRELAKIQIGHRDVKVRSMSAVLLRRIVQPTSKITVDQSTMQFLQQAMIKAFNEEPTPSTLRKVCNAIGPIAARYVCPLSSHSNTYTYIHTHTHIHTYIEQTGHNFYLLCLQSLEIRIRITERVRCFF